MEIQLGHHSVETRTVLKHLRERNLLIGASVHSMTEFLNCGGRRRELRHPRTHFRYAIQVGLRPATRPQAAGARCANVLPSQYLRWVGLILRTIAPVYPLAPLASRPSVLFQTSESLQRAVRGIHDFLPDR